MHPDDLDEIYFEVADKLGISTNSAEKNPYFERVDTVKDLVLFLCNQQKLKDALQKNAPWTQKAGHSLCVCFAHYHTNRNPPSGPVILALYFGRVNATI